MQLYVPVSHVSFLFYLSYTTPFRALGCRTSDSILQYYPALPLERMRLRTQCSALLHYTITREHRLICRTLTLSFVPADRQSTERCSGAGDLIIEFLSDYYWLYPVHASKLRSLSPCVNSPNLVWYFSYFWQATSRIWGLLDIQGYLV
jgi:hypothetical protein